MKTTIALKASDHLSLDTLIKASGLSKSLIQQLIAKDKTTVQEAVNEWKQWITDLARSQRTAICHISYVDMWLHHAKFSAKTKIVDVTSQEISRFLNAKDGTKLATRRARMAALRNFFKFCTIRKYVTYDPSQEAGIKWDLLTHEQKETSVKLCFTDKELQAIDDYLLEKIVDLAGHEQTPPVEHRMATAQFWRVATKLGRYSGLRLSDICGLEKASLKDPSKLIVWTAKKNTRVEQALIGKLTEAIALIPKSSDKRYVFPIQAEIHRDTSKRSKLSVQFMRICEACGIEGKSFHCLRHQFASELNGEGKPIEDIAAALGHGSSESTKVYLHEPAMPR